MSRSNNTEIINPAKLYLDWVGSKGCLKYYDKNLGKKGQQVFIELPFQFLVLDRLSTIRGFSDQDQSGFWSNEVRDTRVEKFTVKTKKGVVDHGLYKDLQCLAKGAQYSQSVYIACMFNNELVIANLQISGSAIGPWIELCKGKDIYKYSVIISEAIQKKKGATTYFEPVYKLSSIIKPETEAKAIELDKILQEYLKSYFSRNNAGKVEYNDTTPEEVVTDKQKEAIKDFTPDPEPDYSKGDKVVEKFEPVEIGNSSPDDLPF